MSKNLYPTAALLLVATAICSSSYAATTPWDEQTVSVQAPQSTGVLKGYVRDAQGAIIGATLHIVGTQSGAITDARGQFTLRGLKHGDQIEVSYMGYANQTIRYTGQKELSILLREDTQALKEVVVTALGIKREKKALGYSVQELKGSDLLESRESNLANALSGKISGLQVIRSGNGPGGSSKIQLRGNNSVTGLNQPLIVVDGIPIDNFTGAQNNDIWNPTADLGNGLSDINPEDIASMSVLKGASAAALYGARAGNGVILITTKSGRKQDGLGITLSSTISAESIFMSPKMQNSFGQGDQGSYDADTGKSWGAKITGQEYTAWNGEKRRMAHHDNVGNYFDTGTNFTESFSLAQQYKATAIYVSLTRMDDRSKIPGATLKRTNFTSRATSSFGQDDRWSIDAKVQYIQAEAANRPIGGKNVSNAFTGMYLLPRSLDIRDFSAATREDGKMLWYGKSQQINPYWMQHYKLNQDTRDRFLISGSLKYKFAPWLTGEIKGGSDMYFTQYDDKTYAGSSLKNSYRTAQERFFEHNLSFLFSAQKDEIFGKWGASATLGGNLMHRKSRSVEIGLGELRVPNLFIVSNGVKPASPTERFSHKKINSLYGTAQLSYDGFLFVDATFRNDWSSTMIKEHRSFFYPSLSASWIVSEMLHRSGIELPKWFSYAKLRASYAEVGNDLEPYQLYNTYSIGQSPDTQTTAELKDTLYDPNVRSELIKSWEIGAELRLLGNRLNLDFSWYKTNAIRQLLNLPVDNLSGYKYRKINAGNIENMGWEAMLTARPIELANGFSWDLTVNLSSNRNKIIELYNTPTEQIKIYPLGGYDNVQINAVAGGNYGEIWGTTYKRVTDPQSPYYGKIITADGLPTANTEKEKIGDQQPDALLGVGSTLSYRGWSLNFLFDARLGGHIFSGTHQLMQQAGTAEVTVSNGDRASMVVDGVFLNKAGQYEPNKTEITPQQYWETVTGISGNLGVGELNIYKATNVRLRNLGLSYSFDRGLLKGTPFTQIKLGVSCNNVWMLKSYLKGIDPESVYATSTNATGFEFASAPTSRTLLFNVTLGF